MRTRDEGVFDDSENVAIKQLPARTKKIEADMRKKIQNYRDRRNRIIDEVEADDFHTTERTRSRFLFDGLLEECRNGRCPALPKNLWFIHCLTDISLDGYILQTAYLQSLKPNVNNDVGRYLDATQRIRTILECELPPTLDPALLYEDSRQINEGTSWKCKYEGARKRKAYWTYLKDRIHRNGSLHGEDYRGADDFIRELHAISLKSQCDENDLQRVQTLPNDSFHIANALDLYRLCVIRAKLV